MDMQAHASCAQVRPVKCFAGAHAGLVAIVSVAKAGCIACHSIDIASFVETLHIRARLTADRPEILSHLWLLSAGVS